jgi:heme/copper-type cytochrome/quinol oxidase subunit 2
MTIVLFFISFCVYVWPVVSLADAPAPWQMGFQDPATKAMMGIVDLHHDICFFLITILILVLWLGGRILYSFHHTRQPTPERFNHHTSLELVWAIFPSLIIAIIALPSLTLIYSFDDLAADPYITVKVVGRQWFWVYFCKESVVTTLVDPQTILKNSSKKFY